MEEQKEKSNNVKSILKAFSILEELNSKSEMSIAEISEKLQMDKATVHRLINTIKEAGYIIQNPDNKKYSNSFKLFAMGSRVMERTGIKQIARPYIERLAEETGETVNLGVRIGGCIAYIDKIESNSTIKVGIDIGTTIPDYCTGMGKAVLAFLPQDEKDKILQETTFKMYTKKTLKDTKSLEDELDRIRTLGYSCDNEEYVEGLISYGAPLMDFHGFPVGAISVSYPKYRYEKNNETLNFSEKVIITAAEISRQLGYKMK